MTSGRMGKPPSGEFDSPLGAAVALATDREGQPIAAQNLGPKMLSSDQSARNFVGLSGGSPLVGEMTS